MVRCMIIDGVLPTRDLLAFRDLANTGIYDDKFWKITSPELWTELLIIYMVMKHGHIKILDQAQTTIMNGIMIKMKLDGKEITD